MIKKTKLLICMLAMSVLMSALPGVSSEAAEADGEILAAASQSQDENSQRLGEVTAMDQNGNIYEIQEDNGTVAGEETNGPAIFLSCLTEAKVVNFNTKGNATTNYTDSNGESGYTNGAYGADAAYLGTTADGKIRFMLSGVTGTVNASEVQILNYSDVADRVSYYTVSGGTLIHYISQNMNKTPSSAVSNGPAPSFLAEGGKYFSYDGHYFYTDYAVMISDYQSGGRNGAVNTEEKFSNYFQFADMKESTAYTAEVFNRLLNDALKSKGKDSTSRLWDTGSLFVKYQNTYGVNALLSASIAINESGWGMSSISQIKNNLFGLNAQDSNVGNASSYYSVESCIIDFMKNWMADGYLSSSSWKNFGEYLGNKGGGINVKYASDPYWGEKAAAHAWMLDKSGGSLDCPDRDSQDVPVATPAPDESSKPETPDGGTQTEEPDEEDTVKEPENPEVPETGQEQPDAGAGSSNGEESVDKPDDGSAETDGAGSSGVTEPGGGTQDTPTVEDKPIAENKPVEEENPVEENVSQQPVQTTVRKEISDSGNRISVDGLLSENASISVTEITSEMEKYGSYVSLNLLKDKEILGVYDITLTGEMEGEVLLTFTVGQQYNGRTVTIFHHLDNGSYETYEAVVQNGTATIRVNGFSPYTVALNPLAVEESGTARAPQTGDSFDKITWTLLVGASVCVIMAVLLKRKAAR